MTRWVLPTFHEFSVSDEFTLCMTARSIAVDDVESDDGLSPASSSAADGGAAAKHALDKVECIVGELEGGDDATHGTVADVIAHTVWFHAPTLSEYATKKVPLSLDGVVGLLHKRKASLPPVFFRSGDTTFRLFNAVIDFVDPIDPPLHQHEQQQQQGTDHVNASPQPLGSTPHRRAKDRYTSAVAFEFVTNVINNVLGDELYPS